MANTTKIIVRETRVTVSVGGSFSGVPLAHTHTESDITDLLHTPVAHALAGSAHNADTLTNLNTKVSDATLDDSGATRKPKITDEVDGDLMQFDGSNWIRVPKGEAGQVLKSDGTDVAWQDDLVQITLGTDEDPLTVADDKAPIDLVLGFAITITEVLFKVKAAPTDADIQVSLQGSGAGDESFVDIVLAANGVISAGSKFGSTTSLEDGTSARAKNSILRINQDQVGSTIAGSILTVTVIGKKT